MPRGRRGRLETRSFGEKLLSNILYRFDRAHHSTPETQHVFPHFLFATTPKSLVETEVPQHFFSTSYTLLLFVFSCETRQTTEHLELWYCVKNLWLDVITELCCVLFVWRRVEIFKDFCILCVMEVLSAATQPLTSGNHQWWWLFFMSFGQMPSVKSPNYWFFTKAVWARRRVFSIFSLVVSQWIYSSWKVKKKVSKDFVPFLVLVVFCVLFAVE